MYKPWASSLISGFFSIANHMWGGGGGYMVQIIKPGHAVLLPTLHGYHLCDLCLCSPKMHSYTSVGRQNLEFSTKTRFTAFDLKWCGC